MQTVLAIGAGAWLGALARWQLGIWLNPVQTTSWSTLPWGTISANLIGAYLIGVCVAVFNTWPELSPQWRLLLVTGFLGALTTFSTFSVELVQLLQEHRYIFAITSASLQLLGSLVLTLAGMRTIEWMVT